MSPKKTFQDGDYSKDWGNIAETKMFEVASQAALLQMQFDLGAPHDANEAAVNFYCLMGAERFVKILASLHIRQPEVQPTKLKGNLNHAI